MNIALFYLSNLSEEGGTGYVLECLIKSVKKIKGEKLYFFNPYYKDRDCIKIDEYRNFNLKKIISSLKKITTIKTFITCIWRILRDKKTKFSNKLKVIIYSILKAKYTIFSLNLINQISSYIIKFKIDVILGGATTSPHLILTYFLSRLFDKKLTSFSYGNDFLVKSRFSLQSIYIRNIDLIFLGTEKTKDLIKKIHHLDDNQLSVIPYGLIIEDYKVSESKEELREKFKIQKNCFIILSVGRHVSRKNFDLVIKAIDIIKKTHPNIDLKYYLIGEGESTKYLKDLTKKLKLEDQIKFLGFIDIYRRNQFYKLSDVFVMPSTTERESIEGFGIVYIEANYFNCPTIGTYSGGITEAIINGKTGFLIKPNDLNELVEKILFLYNNKIKRQNMGFYGHQRVLSEFNWELIIDKYITNFKRLILKK